MPRNVGINLRFRWREHKFVTNLGFEPGGPPEEEKKEESASHHCEHIFSFAQLRAEISANAAGDARINAKMLKIPRFGTPWKLLFCIGS